MPCYEIREIGLDLNVADLETLAIAIEAQTGATVTVRGKTLEWAGGRYSNGQMLTTRGDDSQLKDIRKEYTARMWAKSAKRFGWKTYKNQRGQWVAEKASYSRR